MRRRWLPVFCAVLGTAAYVGVSALGPGPGFPLDDGWIHQAYARNLVQSGRWEFVPGVVSAGSTAPLWTLLLAVGYLLRLPYLLWSYLLGTLSLIGLAWAGMRLWRALWPRYADRDWIAGLVLVFTWPLIWAAASGMETLLFMALGAWLLALYVEAEGNFGPWPGLLAGLLILTRPEGLILVLLLSTGLLLQQRFRHLAAFLLVALLPLVPYFAFNLSISGAVWPNTFYAKQTEYGALLERALPLRFLDLLRVSLGGAEAGWQGMSSAHLLLVPGLLLAGWRSLQADWRRGRLLHLLPLLWAGGHVLAYAWRLPVTYQHGRYLWAALPVWILYGLAGWGDLLWQGKRWSRIGRLLRQTAPLVFAVMLLLFFMLGAQAYASDVGFIQNEMVDVAYWLRENTAPDTLIAAHDIGAIGYFAQRPLLDLAGLVSPQVISLLADEAALARYVRQSNAEYLVTAPGWPYEELTTRGDVRLIYSTDYAWTREQGLNNMEVYALPE